LPAAINAAEEACSAAIAVWMERLDALALSAAAKAASLLHVSAQVSPAAPKRNCLLLISDSVILTALSSGNRGFLTARYLLN
jgi:hypothetical protein